nr:hypothetical protein CFP56_23302 [Quercus suber]
MDEHKVDDKTSSEGGSLLFTLHGRLQSGKGTRVTGLTQIKLQTATLVVRTLTAAGFVIWRFGFREVEKGDFGLKSFLSPNLQNLQPDYPQAFHGLDSPKEVSGLGIVPTCMPWPW